MGEGINRSLHPGLTRRGVPDRTVGAPTSGGEGGSFAAWLRTAMGARGVTCAELARRARVSRAAVSSWLGGRTHPSAASLAAIAAALDLEPETVLAAAGVEVIDDDRTARIADLLGKVDRVRLTPDRISGLGGILDAWLAADRLGAGPAGSESRAAPAGFVVRFVPNDDRPPVDLERVPALETGAARLSAVTATLGERGETGEVRLVGDKGARVFGERVVARKSILPRGQAATMRGTGPPAGPRLNLLAAKTTSLREPAIGQDEPAAFRSAKEIHVASTQPLAASDKEEQVYTLAEAARLKGVSYHTVSRAVRQGKLPHHRLGRMAFITAGNLAAWRPMVERAPKKYARRVPDPAAAPAMLDLASGDRVLLAQRFSILSEVLHAAAADKPIGEVLDLLSRRFAESLDFDRVSIWELDGANGSVRRLASFGRPMSGAGGDQSPDLAGGIWQLAGVESATVRDAASLSQPHGPLAGVTTLFVAPLRVGRRSIGLVLGDRGGAAFSLDDDQLAFAQALANQASLAIEVAEAHDRLATLA